MIKTPNGRRFGGYVYQPWSTTRGFKPSTRAFLFRLGGAVGPSGDWRRARAGLKPGHSDEALWHHARYGPSWDAGLYIHYYEHGHVVNNFQYYQPFPENENVAGGVYRKETVFDPQEWEVFGIKE